MHHQRMCCWWCQRQWWRQPCLLLLMMMVLLWWDGGGGGSSGDGSGGGGGSDGCCCCCCCCGCVVVVAEVAVGCRWQPKYHPVDDLAHSGPVLTIVATLQRAVPTLRCDYGVVHSQRASAGFQPPNHRQICRVSCAVPHMMF